MSPLPKRVLIVGAGPSGLVTLRNLMERGDFDHVQLVERRDDVGGVWYLDNPDASPTSKRPRWPSPAYPGLIGNVLPEFLSYSHFPFPLSSPTQPFPTLRQTYAYLRAFAEPFLASGKIRLNTEVVEVDELEGGGWKVVLRQWCPDGQGVVKEEHWDGVVIATCWYDYPVYPTTEGIEEAKEKGLVKHSKWWRGPKGYKGKRVVVVANGNSANDMTAQLASVARPPIYRSLRHSGYTNFPFVPDPRVEEVGAVSRYSVISTPNGDKLNLEMKDGSQIVDVDMVLVGTGYGFAAPFVRVLSLTESSPRDLSILTPPSLELSRVPSLHRHILYAPNPTLAFIGLPMSFTPFTLSDASSTWLALAWSGSLTYPESVADRLVEEQERMESLKQRRQKVDEPSSFLAYHVLFPEELQYARALREDIVKAKEEFDGILPVWSDEDWDRRQAMYALKFECLKRARDEGVDGITE